MIRIYLTDDQTLFLDSLKLYLQGEKQFHVLGTFLNGKETLEALKKEQPDLILLDLRLPDITGLEVAETVKREYPKVKIIVLSSFENESDMLSAVAGGIDGYVVKDISPAHLILVINTVMAGFSVMHPGSHEIMRQIIRKEMAHYLSLDGIHNFDSLNIQEWKIVQLVTEGKSNKEIASQLDYTEGTVKNYISRILQKTGCRDRTHLAVQALRGEAQE
ncbi:MAG: response regulator transcription factor [Spirochaetales bacterium]|nr:response regulator transcription factor [Spirochaetales bacterium]